MKKTLAIAATTAAVFAAAVAANPQRDAIVAGYAAQAGVSSFSADAGRTLFLSQNTGGKAATPSCSTCHTTDPTAAGRTRVGKPIDPMAVSRSPDRFTDAAKVEKWFRRNCNSVLGRACTPEEKGNYITYMMSL
jgi:cytochrome c peroxidase